MTDHNFVPVFGKVVELSFCLPVQVWGTGNRSVFQAKGTKSPVWSPGTSSLCWMKKSTPSSVAVALTSSCRKRSPWWRRCAASTKPSRRLMVASSSSVVYQVSFEKDWCGGGGGGGVVHSSFINYVRFFVWFWFFFVFIASWLIMCYDSEFVLIGRYCNQYLLNLW